VLTEQKQKAIDLIQDGYTIHDVSRSIGKSLIQINKARKADANFDAAMTDAMNIRTLSIERQLYKNAIEGTVEIEEYWKAVDGHYNSDGSPRMILVNTRVKKKPPSETAMITMLKAHMPEVYGDRQTIEFNAPKFASPDELRQRLIDMAKQTGRLSEDDILVEPKPVKLPKQIPERQKVSMPKSDPITKDRPTGKVEIL